MRPLTSPINTPMKKILLCLLSVLTMSATAGEEILPWQLFRELAATESGNLTFSPACVENCLKLIARGTDGATRAELEAIPYGQDYNKVNMEPHAATALFIASHLPSTKGKANGVHRLPFATQAEKCTKAINRWASKQTKGHIPQLLDAGVVNRETALACASALFMQEEWLNHFSDTEEEYPFTTGDGKQIPVPMMIQEEKLHIRYAEGEGWQAVLLPVDGNVDKRQTHIRGAFVAIRPEGDVRQFAKQLTPEILKKICVGLAQPVIHTDKEKGIQHEHYTTLKLPRFKTTTPQALNLKPALQKLGIRKIFQPGADFSGYTSAPVFMDTFIQKVHIDVNESGFSASSCSWLSGPLGIPPDKIKKHYHIITFDKPFIYFIGSPDYRITPFFMGICETPEISHTAKVSKPEQHPQ